MSKIIMRLTTSILLVGTLLAIFVLATVNSSSQENKSPNQVDLCPVVISSNEPDKGLLIGGVSNGKWLPHNIVAPRMHGGENYKLYSSKAFLKEVKGTMPVELPNEQNFYIVNILGLSEVTKSFMIAIGDGWNALPRRPVSLDTKKKAFIEAVQAVLVENGLVNSQINITEVLRIDLEGDGIYETLITASSPEYDKYVYNKGQFSLVILQKKIKNKLQNIVLSGEFHLESQTNRYPEIDGITGLWDIDGDGTLEIFLNQLHMRAEVMRGEIYKMKSGKPNCIYSYAVNFG